MLSKFCLFIHLFLISNLAHSEIIFDHIKDEAWKQEILKTMDWVNDQLPADWERPDEFIIVYAEGQENAYYPILHYKDANGSPQYAKQVLVIGNDNQAIFLHEYAHVIMDHWMRKNSLPWQYFVVWQEFGYSDLKMALQERIDKLPNLKKANAEYLEKKANGDQSPIVESAIYHTGQSIIKYEKAIEDIGSILEKSKDFPYSLTSFNSFKALSPYNELFADALAALLLQDWRAVRKGLELEISKMPMETLVLPPLDDPKLALAEFLSYRDFVEGLSIESYSFQDWETSSSYWMFKPFRSEFRRWVEEDNISATLAMDRLGKAILNIYEKSFIPDPEKVDQNLLQKNGQLRDALLKE